MKFLAVMLGLMIAAQPVQAGVCDMEEAGDPMQHAGMLHDSGDDASAHSCCLPSDNDEGADCADMAQCAPCASATAAVPSVAATSAPESAQHRPWSHAGQLAPSHTSPPFRPPKHIS